MSERRRYTPTDQQAREAALKRARKAEQRRFDQITSGHGFTLDEGERAERLEEPISFTKEGGAQVTPEPFRERAAKAKAAAQVISRDEYVSSLDLLSEGAMLEKMQCRKSCGELEGEYGREMTDFAYDQAAKALAVQAEKLRDDVSNNIHELSKVVATTENIDKFGGAAREAQIKYAEKMAEGNCLDYFYEKCLADIEDRVRTEQRIDEAEIRRREALRR